MILKKYDTFGIHFCTGIEIRQIFQPIRCSQHLILEKIFLGQFADLSKDKIKSPISHNNYFPPINIISILESKIFLISLWPVEAFCFAQL